MSSKIENQNDEKLIADNFSLNNNCLGDVITRWSVLKQVTIIQFSKLERHFTF